MIIANICIFISNTLNYKPGKSGHRGVLTVIPRALIMCHADIVSPFEVLNDHICPSLVACSIVAQHSDLWHVVYDDVWPQVLSTVLYSSNIEDIHSGNRGGEDSSFGVISFANIWYDFIENQSPAVPGWAGWYYGSR